MSNLDNIEHIVVLMLENRSFDNILGWLYDYENNPKPFNKPPKGTYNGVNSTMSNPAPPDDVVIRVARGTDITAPFPDPNEPYEYVYRQMYGLPPTMPIPNTDAAPTMKGFILDYQNAIATANAKNKKKCWLFRKPALKTDPGIIMNCFPPEALPVINGLAQNYAVCDNWFSSVPTQTFPNRSFIHAATSSGNVYNTWKTGVLPWDVGVFVNKTPTIYNLLEEKGVSWKIYHGGPLLLCNALIIQEKLWEYALTDHFSPYKEQGLFNKHTFLSDLENNNLPAYSFIEPNMVCSSKYGPENDMHPAWAVYDTGAPTNVLYGDELIYEIYTALRASDYWDKTLFVITFDEHGGTFDHYPTPPPPAVSPDGVVIPYTDGGNGGSNFNFERFGVRVPAVLVSPWIEEGTICHTQFDHTSVLKTVSNKWLGGRQHLTKRDAAANCIGEVLTSTLRKDKPDITMITPPPFEGCKHQELSPLQRDLIAAAAHFVANTSNRLIELNALDTNEKAVAELENIAEDLL